MTRYLLDTNILSALVRTSADAVIDRIDAVGEDNVYTSVIAAGELRFGAAKKSSARFSAEVEAVLSRIRVGELRQDIDRVYAGLRRDLEAKGAPIGANDLWIAAHAIADESVIVTDNTREFGRVPDLRLENWLRG